MSFTQPLLSQIVVPDEIDYVYLRVTVEADTYYYSYSFDNEKWHQINIVLDSTKLSDDYISGGGFFTGAFVGMQCEDMSGQRIAADFKYFAYRETDA